MNNATSHTATADQHNAASVKARCCDAFDPCVTCRGHRMSAQAHRHLARVGAGSGMMVTVTATPEPWASILADSLIAARETLIDAGYDAAEATKLVTGAARAGMDPQKYADRLIKRS